MRAVSRLSSRASCVASAGRVRTTVSRFSALRCVTVAFGSCRSPRATAPRELCGDCYVGGTLLPAWTFTSGIASPAFTMAATERERFAAGGSVLLLYGPRACHLQQCQPSEGGFAKTGRTASRRHEPYYASLRTTQHARARFGLGAGISHTRHHIKQPCCPPQRPPGTHCWCHKHRTPSKRSEKQQ